jgi:hypothetical protein
MLVPATTSLPADWILDDCRGFPPGVGYPVPHGFAAYARLFHPVARGVGASIPTVRWSEIASVLGTTMRADVQWAELIAPVEVMDEGDLPAEWDGVPATGSLPAAQASALARTLAVHTQTPGQGWFGVWIGWGSLDGKYRNAPRVALPHRETVLLSGSVADASQNVAAPESLVHQSANLWWPDDHAWVVSTEVDEMTSYVGASEEAISDLLSNVDLEIQSAALR